MNEEIKKQYPEYTGKTSSNFVNLSGNKYNNLEVLYRYYLNKKDGTSQYVCKLGDKILILSSTSIRRGHYQNSKDNYNKLGIIYIIENDINDKKYIGVTVQTLNDRWKNHLNTIEDKDKLHSAMKELGIDHFYIKELEKVNICDLSHKENEYIKKFNTIQNGYNSFISGYTPAYALNINEELLIQRYKEIKIIKFIALEFDCSIDTVRRILLKHNIDSYDMSTVMKQRVGRRVAKINKDTGEVIKYYDAVIDAEHDTGIKYQNIIRVCKGGARTAGGFVWAYADEQ